MPLSYPYLKAFLYFHPACYTAHTEEPKTPIALIPRGTNPGFCLVIRTVAAELLKQIFHNGSM